MSIEDWLLFQYVFEDEEGIHPLDTLGFKPDKRGARILLGKGKGDVLYGHTDNGNLIWDANGNLYVAGPRSKGFLAYGKTGPGSVLSNTENVGDRDDAMLGSATMLATLLESPVVQNLVEGRGPNGETKGADKLIVSEIRKDFAAPKKPFFPRGGMAKYEDDWPRLMAFIGEVNKAFNKREEEKGIPNPLVELMFGNARGRDNDLADMFLATDKEGKKFIVPSANGINKIGLAGQPGESEEDFYKRQADTINRHKETLNLRSEVSNEDYYDWVIDKMVRNLRAAANALSEKDRTLRNASLERLRSRVSTHVESERKRYEEYKKELRQKHWDTWTRKVIPSYGGLARLLRKYIRDIVMIDAAMKKVKAWPKHNSLADRIAALERKAKAAKDLNAFTMLELEAEKDPLSEEEFKMTEGRLTGALKASEAVEKGASSLIGRLKKLEEKGGKDDEEDEKKYVEERYNEEKYDEEDEEKYDENDYSIRFCLTELGNFKGIIKKRLQDTLHKWREARNKVPAFAPSGIKSAPDVSPGIMMYQMAVPGDQIVTLDDYYSGKRAVADVINSNMRMVAMGILLGGTGMPLEEVKDNCDEYFRLRMMGRRGRPTFMDLFGVDPTRIPSDERIKDFHHNWKRIGEARDTQRNIIDAVHRRFF